MQLVHILVFIYVRVIETHHLKLAAMESCECFEKKRAHRAKHKFSHKRAFKISLHLWSLKFKMPFERSQKRNNSEEGALETARHPGVMGLVGLHKANLQRMRQVKNASHLPNTLNIQNHIGPASPGIGDWLRFAYGPDNILCLCQANLQDPSRALKLECKHTLPSFMLPAIAV